MFKPSNDWKSGHLNESDLIHSNYVNMHTCSTQGSNDVSQTWPRWFHGTDWPKQFHFTEVATLEVLISAQGLMTWKTLYNTQVTYYGYNIHCMGLLQAVRTSSHCLIWRWWKVGAFWWIHIKNARHLSVNNLPRIGSIWTPLICYDVPLGILSIVTINFIAR